MSRDSGSEDPSKRTVAELLAEHGGSGGSQRSARRRRRRAEDPSETAPQAIIDRVISDSGRMRPVPPEEDTAQGSPPEQQPPPVNDEAPSPPAPAVSQPATAESESTEEASDSSAPNFWARRFSAAGSAPEGTRQTEHNTGARAPAPVESDAETTVQQPALPKRPVRKQGPTPPRVVPNGPATQAVPVPPAPEAVPPRDGGVSSAQGTPAEAENATEQFPPVEGTLDSETTASVNGTALLAHPPEEQRNSGPEVAPEGAYDSLSYEADHDVYTADYDDFDYDDHDYGDFDYDDDRDYDDLADDVDDTYDPELPAGMEAEDYLEGEAAQEEWGRTPSKEWLLLATQGGVGLFAGGLVWIGFRWLWTAIPIAALVAAIAITGLLVLIARRFLRTDDLQTILLAVLVGLTCTVSPAALLLIGY